MSDVSGTCNACGSSVYRQHIDSGIARYEGGKLMCAHCVAEFEAAHSGVEDQGYEPIELDTGDEELKVDLSQSRIHSASAATLGRAAGGWDDKKFKRQLDTRAISATRCRTFHSKLSEAALDFMNNQINEWLDSNESINIKFAASTIGIFEGKHAEPNLILTLFY